MAWLEAALHETAEYPHPESLHCFETHLDRKWIDEALAASGTATLRKRRLPADQVIWLVLGMALMRDRSISDVVQKLDLVLPGADGEPIAPSAITQARTRLGEEPLRWLFGRTAAQWSHASARRHQWRGLALYGADGTTLRVADSDENREHFGLASGGNRGQSGYPLVRLTALMALRSHLLAGVQFGPYSESEQEQASHLWEQVPDDSLTIVDRNYFSAATLLSLQGGGKQRHWLIRTKSNVKWTEVETYGDGDKLVELNVSKAARQKHPELPATYRARAIRYQYSDSKGPQWVLSSLVDPEVFPAAEIVALYHERWEIEIGYDELKTHMLDREETIRSRKVVGVRQEIWGILLAYNLVRLEMERIAAEADVAPSRISFLTSIRYIRDEWQWCAIASPGSIPKKLKRMRERVRQFVLPPRRTSRRYPRAVKIKMSNYAKKKRKSDTNGLK